VFDGIDVLTLPVADVASLRELYVDGFGFRVMGESAQLDPRWQAVWSLPAAPRRALLLGKAHSKGGWIRLVEVPGLPPATPAGRPDREGPYALDFYVRDAGTLEAQLALSGRTFRSEPQHYLLPGTDHPVRERMLVQPESGLLHAIVEYRPGRTRCVLADSPGETSSEVVAAVFFTAEFAAAGRFAEDVLGAHRYYSGRFDGEAVEGMLGLGPGEGFEAALFRGPSSRNARLEFAETMPRADGGSASADSVPRVIAGCAVDDLEALGARLAGGEHGHSTPLLVMPDGRPRIGLASRYGAAFEFWQRDEAGSRAVEEGWSDQPRRGERPRHQEGNG
jgi:catechol 2,3-dioxygenase-like lactoylglutathione lyase family enzyme